MNRHLFLRNLVLLFSAAILASCTGGAALRFERLAGATEKEEYLSAISTIKKNAKKLYGKTNQLLYHIDIGVLFHYAGRYDSSNVYLLKANDVFNDLFARSITGEAASFMVNDNVRPYRSRPYELVLLHQFIAFNFLAQGNIDEALVEARQVDLLMQELERKDKRGAKYSTDGMFHYISSIAYDGAGQADEAMISLFKAVEAFKKGPVPLPRPIRDFASHMLQKNDRAGDLKLLDIPADAPRDKAAAFENGQTEIVLVGYAGRGPALENISWSGTYIQGGMLLMNHSRPNGTVETMQMLAPPLPPAEYEKAAKGQKTSAGTTFHVSFSLPGLKTLPSQTSFFTVRGASFAAPESSVVVNDLDSQVRKNIDDTRAATIARTVVRVVLRTIAAQKAKNEMQTQSPVANLLIGIGTDILADQLEHADTRSCFLFPKTIQVARIPVKPGTYTLESSAHNQTGSVLGTKTFETVTVKKGEKKFLFYSSFR